eukprot:CAMPEP_0206044946 /NCGR_PEP_ID=MMETSP1466-20131121/14426_1 /ASSEMBLY_ACC=CAM_ASM_001126 /TAXON_ID=44452 /ORGANISM="Pavlova gyrans, Strain CCMP608" /LENGTH=253 /DNA_ID=CAMNT_0053419859 /DNA_START=20 /DNA_END=779 /DNA_ORIENTATION=+
MPGTSTYVSVATGTRRGPAWQKQYSNRRSRRQRTNPSTGTWQDGALSAAGRRNNKSPTPGWQAELRSSCRKDERASAWSRVKPERFDDSSGTTGPRRLAPMAAAVTSADDTTCKSHRTRSRRSLPGPPPTRHHESASPFPRLRPFFNVPPPPAAAVALFPAATAFDVTDDAEKSRSDSPEAINATDRAGAVLGAEVAIPASENVSHLQRLLEVDALDVVELALDASELLLDVHLALLQLAELPRVLRHAPSKA